VAQWTKKTNRHETACLLAVVFGSFSSLMQLDKAVKKLLHPGVNNGQWISLRYGRLSHRERRSFRGAKGDRPTLA
jgi:hypothetical protein